MTSHIKPAIKSCKLFYVWFTYRLFILKLWNILFLPLLVILANAKSQWPPHLWILAGNYHTYVLLNEDKYRLFLPYSGR